MATGLKRRYKIYELLDNGYDAYNKPIKEMIEIKEIDMIVVIKNFDNKTPGLEYTEVGHLGLTTFKGLVKGHKIVAKDGSATFTVEFVNNVARLAQITLKEVKV